MPNRLKKHDLCTILRNKLFYKVLNDDTLNQSLLLRQPLVNITKDLTSSIYSVILCQNDLLYILGQFEGDQISPRESAKNGRNGAHGLNCIIFVNSEVIFEIYDKNYPIKKFQVSRPILNFLPLNQFKHFSIFGLLGFVGAIQFLVG